MTADEQYIIDTPENVAFRYNIAGIGSRFLATLIDTLLLLIIQLVLTAVMLFGLSLLPDDWFGVLSIIWILLGFVFFWGYYIFFEMVWNGQTPGKRAVRLRVVREGGRPITFAASAVRNLIRFIDFLPGFYGLGVLVMFIDRQARRLGDLAGGTTVVKERPAVSLDKLAERADPPPLPRRPDDANEPLLPNLHMLSDHDYDLLQEFLRRRSELGRTSRMQLGIQLANGIYSRLELTTGGGDHEKFLERVAYDYRRHREEMRGYVAQAPAEDRQSV